MHITKNDLMVKTRLSPLDVARWMNNLRNTTYNSGGKVVRVIRNGEVVEQYVGGVPRHAK